MTSQAPSYYGYRFPPAVIRQAAFVGGLVFGNRLQSSVDFIEEFMESEGQLLTIFTFLI